MIKQRLYILFFIIFFAQTQLNALHHVAGYFGAITGADVGKNFGIESTKRFAKALKDGATLGHALSPATKISLNMLSNELKRTARIIGKLENINVKLSTESETCQIISDLTAQLGKLENIKIKHDITPDTRTTLSGLFTQGGLVVGGTSLMIGSISVLKSLSHHYLTKSDISSSIGAAIGTCSLIGFLAGAALVHNSASLSK